MTKNGMPSGLPRAVKLRDVWMIQTGEEIFFAMKATDDLIPIDSSPNEFKRDFAIQLSILRKINIAHSAAADKRKDFVVTDRFFGVSIRGDEPEYQQRVRWQAAARIRSRLLELQKRLNFCAQLCIRAAFVIEE